MGHAKLQQHLRSPQQRQAIPDQGADRGGLQGLGVQAREHPPACRMGQQTMQRLAGPQPVSPAITGRKQHGGGRRRRAAGG